MENAVGLGQNRNFIRSIRRYLRDLSENVLSCTNFEAKEKEIELSYFMLQSQHMNRIIKSCHFEEKLPR